jgi:hypothetical protein
MSAKKTPLATQARNLELIRDRVLPSARGIRTVEGDLIGQQLQTSIDSLYAMAPYEDAIRAIVAGGAK